MKHKLTPRQAAFISEYLVDLNGLQAAIRAGYSPHTAAITANRLLTNTYVAVAIGEAQRKRSERTAITADMVVREYTKLAFASIADVVSWDRGGVYVRPSAELAPEVLASVAAVKIKRRRETDAEGRAWDVEEIEVKLHDKQRALDSLAKHLGMFPKAPLIEVNDNRSVTLMMEQVDAIIREAGLDS